MPNTHILTDAVDFSQVLVPAAYTSTSTGSAYVDMRGYEGGVFFVSLGTVSGTSPTLDLAVKQATDASGTGAKAVSGATSSAQITSTGGSKTYAIEFRPGQLDLANGFYFVSITFTIAGTSPSFTGEAVLIRHRGRTFPVSTSLTQQVKV